MRTTILILLSLLFMGSQQAQAQLKPAKRWATIYYDTPSYTDLPMVKLSENAISVYKWDGQKHVFSHKKTEPSE